MFAHGWRQEPIEVLDEILLEREMSLSPVLEPNASAAEPALMVLSEPEFRQAVRRALRAYHRAGALAASPLCHSHLARERAAGEPVATLRALLGEGVETLAAAPRLRKLHDAIRHTWLEPAGTQEAVAGRCWTCRSAPAGELWRRERALGTAGSSEFRTTCSGTGQWRSNTLPGIGVSATRRLPTRPARDPRRPGR